MASRPPRTGDPGGFGLGRRVTGELAQLGISQTQWRWKYGIGSRDSFPPHLNLAGAFLEQLPTDDGWYPGDHKGCMCTSVPVLRGSDGRFVTPGVLI